MHDLIIQTALLILHLNIVELCVDLVGFADGVHGAKDHLVEVAVEHQFGLTCDDVLHGGEDLLAQALLEA